MNTAPLPPARGPCTEHLFQALRTGAVVGASLAGEGPLSADDEDRQLALYVLHELGYGGFDDVPAERERDAGCVGLRLALEDAFEAWLHTRVALPDGTAEQAIDALIAQAAVGTAQVLSDEGDRAVLVRLVICRSAYQLKEADPHTLAIPHLRGPERKIVAEVQAGEYGVGHARTHAELFAATMQALGLDPTPNRYLAEIPAVWLAMPNLLSMHASSGVTVQQSVGELALLELDSVAPNTVISQVIEELGLSEEVRRFFAIHVLADREHEAMMREVLREADPDKRADRIRGAAALQAVLDLQGRELAAWVRAA